MGSLANYISYANAQSFCAKEALWALFDWRRDSFNISQECLDRHPSDAVAIHVVKAEVGINSYTFRELSRGANRFANHLMRRGCKMGDVIAIMLELSFEFCVSMFGAIKAGYIGVPLFTLFGYDGLRLRVDDCRPKLIVTNEDKATIVRNMRNLDLVISGREFNDLLAFENAEFGPATSANAIAVYQYASGTTREMPEAVRHTHGSVVTLR